MSGNGYDGRRQNRRRRHEPDPYERDDYDRPRHGSRASDDPDDWRPEPDPYAEPGRHQEPDQYGNGYQGADSYPGGGWSPGPDNYGYPDAGGRTDPRGGQPDYYGHTDPGGRTDPRGGQPGYYPQPDPYAGRDDYTAPGQGQAAGYDGYRDSGYGGADPYASQQPYGGQPGYDNYADQPGYDQDGYGGAGAYQGQPGYETGPYGRPDEYRQDAYGGQPGYGPDDGYRGYGGPAASGPLAAYPADDQYGQAQAEPVWQAQENGIGAAGGHGDDYRHGARRDRAASRYQQDDIGHDGPLGGSRRSGREMQADDDRHSGFFSGFASNDDDHYGKQPRSRRGRSLSAGTIALILIVAVILGIGGVGYHYYSRYKSLHASYTGNGYGSVVVTVPPGASFYSIGPELKKLDVIAAIDPWAAFVANKPPSLQPGEFTLRHHMGPAQAWAMLVNPKSRVNVTVTIIDGLRYSKYLPMLAAKSHIPLSQFQAAIKDTAALGLPAYAHGNPEGYLYPATYDVAPGESALKILQAAVQKFKDEATALNLAGLARSSGFTEAHIIVGASLLEAEVPPQYYAQVARVIDNRLNARMNLGLDSTVAYATNHYIYGLTQSDLNSNSPYNTTKYPNLPPGPIDSPDAAAILAFTHPAHGGYLYFVTVNKSGLTKFTSSYAQFQQWVQLAKSNGL